ncbi:lipid A biosynthesis lauroyl acyltransferase [Pelagibius sp. Alg239-R121]|uniref:LpxL/LpxP family acyltransferase n=1 Tax=Pelagibius sp. Alg239-R121 TaxID=2993448 RepID=UPI0024A74554|nr:lipid A biosynthesis lauroyl acyltransferase [Pelagibius sp. Alg239-R121]
MAKLRSNKRFQKFVKHPFEAAGLFVTLGLFRLFPVDVASNFGGWLGRMVGPRLGISRRARRNLRLAFPDKTPLEIEKIVAGMWDNLGRVLFEYPHLDQITAREAGRVEVVGADHVYGAAESDRGSILAAGHLANWEVMAFVAGQHGVDLTIIVREPNNPYVQPAVDRLRGSSGGKRISKGSDGARQALQLLKRGGVLGILFDQKMNDGIPVSFFGHTAMTPAAPAQLGLRFGCNIIPVRTERLGAGRFRMTCYPPIEHPDSGNRKEDISSAMESLNRSLETWIAEKPEDWLWLHRRWPQKTYDSMSPES